jgi:hypothetical protein
MEITDNGAPTGAERTCTAGIDGDDEDGLHTHASTAHGVDMTGTIMLYKPMCHCTKCPCKWKYQRRAFLSSNRAPKTGW